MNALINYLVEGLLYENKTKGEVIALIPGGYKPVSISHFHIVDEISKRPEVNKVIVLIGPKERDGITAADSLAIWNIYKKYLNNKVEFKISKTSPVNDVYDYLKEQPQNFYLLVFGREEDSDRFKQAETKYDNVKIISFKDMGEGISGTAARKEITAGNYEGLQRYLPTELTNEEREQVWNIVTHKDQLNEYSSNKHNINLILNDISLRHFQRTPTFKNLLFPNQLSQLKVGDNNITVNNTVYGTLVRMANPGNYQVQKLDEQLTEGKYHDKLVAMAIRKDPDRLTELGQEYLDEAKQVGTLYHFTNYDSLITILEDQYLHGHNDGKMKNNQISFSRNKNLYKKDPELANPVQCAIVFDGDKLSTKYKIQPYKDRNFDRDSNGGEEEEILVVPNGQEGIDNLLPYIKGIILLDKDGLDEVEQELARIEMQDLVLDNDLIESKESLIKELTDHLVSEYTNQQILNPTVFELKPERSMGDPQGQEYTIKPKVREVLLKIADYFWNQTPNPKPYEDVILLGSSANYNWNKYSDIDVHILVDFNKFDDPEMAKAFYNELKSSWNKNHKLKLGNNFIELYVQDINEPNAAEGIYSLINNNWLKQPIYKAIEVDDETIAKKAEPFKKAIDKQLISADLEQIRLLQDRIKNFRKAGLETNGEYSLENLAFKELRNSGYIEKLINLRNQVTDKQLVSESEQKLNVQDIIYKQDPTILKNGIKKEQEFLRAWLPQVVKGVWEKTMREREPFWKWLDSFKGSIKRVPLSSIKPSQTGEDYENNSSKHEAEIYKKILSGEKTSKDVRVNDFYPILVDGTTNKIIDGNHRHYALSAINSPYAVCLFVNIPKENLGENILLKEAIEKPYVKYLKQLLDYCCEDLQIEKPELAIINGNKYTQQNNSFGGYSPTENKIWLVIKNRNLSDSMRTLAHELKHHSQNLKGELSNGAGKDGDQFENEANSYAGKIMREFNRKHPEILTLVNV